MNGELGCHTNPEVVEMHATGAISSEGAETLEEHLLLCELCRQSLLETEADVASMRRAAATYRTPKVQRAWAMVPMLAAGCFLVLLAFALCWPAMQPTRLAVNLTAMRSEAGVPRVTAGRALRPHPHLIGVARCSSYRLEIVNRDGRRVWHGTLAPPTDTVVAAGQQSRHILRSRVFGWRRSSTRVRAGSPLG
jgi:hypothetical protein